MKLSVLIFPFILFSFINCSKQNRGELEAIVDNYYQIYNKRQDIDRFMEFYDDDIVLEDMINGDRIEGKKSLMSFLNWENPNFRALDANTLVISDKIIDNNQVVVKGYFTGFQWGQSKFEAMHFTTILTFNELKKIVKQVDWVNYPATLVNYSERKNSNEWIKLIE